MRSKALYVDEDDSGLGDESDDDTFCFFEDYGDDSRDWWRTT